MAKTSTYLEAAHEKILRWCLFEFREMGRQVHVDVEPDMQEAIHRLRQRPELLRFVLFGLVEAQLTNFFLAKHLHLFRKLVTLPCRHPSLRLLHGVHRARLNYTHMIRCGMWATCLHGSIKLSLPNVSS